jgi:hypothetical protein
MSIEPRPDGEVPQNTVNERLMLREWAASGRDPVHSAGYLFSVSLVEKIGRDREEMGVALKHRREVEEPGR